MTIYLMFMSVQRCDDEGYGGCRYTALGAGGRRFKSGRPDQHLQDGHLPATHRATHSAWDECAPGDFSAGEQGFQPARFRQS